MSGEPGWIHVREPHTDRIVEGFITQEKYDLQGDRITLDAFVRRMPEIAQNAVIIYKHGHDVARGVVPLGLITKWRPVEDRIQIQACYNRGNEIIDAIWENEIKQYGDKAGFSIGGAIPREAKSCRYENGKKLCDAMDVIVCEVSWTPHPANPGARVTYVNNLAKGLKKMPDKTDIEKEVTQKIAPLLAAILPQIAGAAAGAIMSPSKGQAVQGPSGQVGDEEEKSEDSEDAKSPSKEEYAEMMANAKLRRAEARQTNDASFRNRWGEKEEKEARSASAENPLDETKNFAAHTTRPGDYSDGATYRGEPSSGGMFGTESPAQAKKEESKSAYEGKPDKDERKCDCGGKGCEKCKGKCKKEETEKQNTYVPPGEERRWSNDPASELPGPKSAIGRIANTMRENEKRSPTEKELLERIHKLYAPLNVPVLAEKAVQSCGSCDDYVQYLVKEGDNVALALLKLQRAIDEAQGSQGMMARQGAVPGIEGGVGAPHVEVPPERDKDPTNIAPDRSQPNPNEQGKPEDEKKMPEDEGTEKGGTDRESIDLARQARRTAALGQRTTRNIAGIPKGTLIDRSNVEIVQDSLDREEKALSELEKTLAELAKLAEACPGSGKCGIEAKAPSSCTGNCKYREELYHEQTGVDSAGKAWETENTGPVKAPVGQDHGAMTQTEVIDAHKREYQRAFGKEEKSNMPDKTEPTQKSVEQRLIDIEKAVAELVKKFAEPTVLGGGSGPLAGVPTHAPEQMDMTRMATTKGQPGEVFAVTKDDAIAKLLKDGVKIEGYQKAAPDITPQSQNLKPGPNFPMQKDMSGIGGHVMKRLEGWQKKGAK